MNTKFWFKVFCFVFVIAIVFGMTTPAAAYNGGCKGKSCDDFPGNGRACEEGKPGKSGKNNPHCNNEVEPPVEPAPKPNPAPDTDGTEKTESLIFSISGRAWLDLNENGIQDNIVWNIPEPSFANITVHLMSKDHKIIARTLTDKLGHYTFNNISDGNYYLIFQLPEGMKFTTQNVGDDTVDSDTNEEGYSDVFVISGNTPSVVIDAGYIVVK